MPLFLCWVLSHPAGRRRPAANLNALLIWLTLFAASQWFPETPPHPTAAGALLSCCSSPAAGLPKISQTWCLVLACLGPLAKAAPGPAEWQPASVHSRSLAPPCSAQAATHCRPLCSSCQWPWVRHRLQLTLACTGAPPHRNSTPGDCFGPLRSPVRVNPAS